MKSFFTGLNCQWRGFRLALRTPRLLFLGLLRLAAVMALAFVAAGFILAYHQEILEALWHRPDSAWLVWLWTLVSWLLALALIGMSSIVSYLLAQVLFAVVVMDMMSRTTERMTVGEVVEPEHASFFGQLGYLVSQEIPRSVIPVCISLFIMVIGWLTPIGPIVAGVSSVVAASFLAWDNTDLLPARRMLPFKERFGMFTGNILFHIGFGLWFLIPVANILFLSFAPVGATLYHLDKAPPPS